MKEIRISGSREPPKMVEPIIYKDIKFTTPFHPKMGYIEARDINTQELLWDLKVYLS